MAGSLRRSATGAQNTDMKLTVIFQLRLTKTNPAPPVLHAFNIEGIGNAALKQSYVKGKEAMLKTFSNYKYIQRIAVVQDLSDVLSVNGIDENVIKDEQGTLEA